jgi:hypothetical protein
VSNLLIFKNNSMNNLNRYNNNKATICYDKVCTTVYGETAQLIKGIVVFAAIAVAAIYIAKALR